jgi:hypothetical protein
MSAVPCVVLVDQIAVKLHHESEVYGQIERKNRSSLQFLEDLSRLI